MRKDRPEPWGKLLPMQSSPHLIPLPMPFSLVFPRSPPINLSPPFLFTESSGPRNLNSKSRSKHRTLLPSTMAPNTRRVAKPRYNEVVGTPSMTGTPAKQEADNPRPATTANNLKRVTENCRILPTIWRVSLRTDWGDV